MFTKCYFLNKARFQGNEYINSRFLNLDMDTQPALMPDEILICDLTIEDRVKKSIFVRFLAFGIIIAALLYVKTLLESSFLKHKIYQLQVLASTIK